MMPRGRYRSSTLTVGPSHSEVSFRPSVAALDPATPSPKVVRSKSGTNQVVTDSIVPGKAEAVIVHPTYTAESLKATSLFLLVPSVQVAVAEPQKKKSSFKSRSVALYAYGILLDTGTKKEIIYNLKELCMIQVEQPVAALKCMPTGSPFVESLKRAKDRAAASDRTLLLCTQNLTRIWIRFAEKSEFLQWILCVDGLLATLYSASLLLPAEKSLFLRERYLQAYEGGSIKIGDNEEWSYLGQSGRLSCVMTPNKALAKAAFHFDGQYLHPEGADIQNCGEWDGINAFWYESGPAPEQSERSRRQTATRCYNWNESLSEFHLVRSNAFVGDNCNAWKFTRTFLARKDGMGGDWIQVEGAVPICLAMFLRLFHEHFDT